MYSRKKYAIILCVITSIAIAVFGFWSVELGYGFSFFYGSTGIILELCGFVFLLISEKKLILRRGGYTADHYVDEETSETPESIIGVPVPKYQTVGLLAIVAGLIFQMNSFVMQYLPKSNPISTSIVDLSGIDLGTFVLAGSTVVLVIITGYYARQTKNTVDVMKQASELSIRPHLKGTFQQIGPSAGDLKIQNIGNGPANKIEISYWTEIKEETRRNWIKPLLMPTESEEFFILKNEKEIELSYDYFKNNQTTIRIVGKYFDILGKEYKIDDKLDLTAYVKQHEMTLVRYQENSDQKIVESIEKVSKSVKELGSEIHRISESVKKKQD